MKQLWQIVSRKLKRGTYLALSVSSAFIFVGSLFLPLATAHADSVRPIFFYDDTGMYSINPDGTGVESYGLGSNPSLSPSGHKVLYIAPDNSIQSCHHGGHGIYTMNPDGTDVVDLTGSYAMCSVDNPVWSPDGNKILFSGTDSNLYLMDEDGSNLYQLPEQGLDPTWSPDGNKIAFVPLADTTGIEVMNADGTDPTEIVSSGVNPTWSPDGNSIAYKNGQSIYTVNPDGANQTLIYTMQSPGGDLGTSLAWSPDSSVLAFDMYIPYQETTYGLYTVSAYGGIPAQVLPGLYSNDPPHGAWSVSWGAGVAPQSGLTSPASLSASSPAQDAALTWDSVPGATSYNIYRNGTKIATTTDNSYTDNPVDGTYGYYVTAVNTNSESTDSNIVSVTVDKTRPDMMFTAPSSFSSDFTTGPTITVTASDSGSGLRIMAIHVYTSSGQLLNICGTATSAQLAAGSQSCSLASLPTGIYYVKAGAFDKANNNRTINSGSFVIQNN